MFKAAVIGCGSIGALKPKGVDELGGRVLTHAHAYAARPDVELVGVVDQFYTQACRAADKWRTTPFMSYGHMLDEDVIPDILSICVNTPRHRDVISEILGCSKLPKIIIVEKPFCATLKQAQEVADALNKAGILALVNYTRRFDPSILMLKHGIDRGIKVQHARVVYGHGLKRDGCHALDLFNFLFGKCMTPVFNGAPPIVDYSEEDPTWSMMLDYERCSNVCLIGVDSRNYDVFELDVFHEFGHDYYYDHGLILRTRDTVEERTYSNGSYKALSGSFTPCIILKDGEPAKNYMDTGLLNCLPNMINHAVDIVANGTAPRCTPEDAIAVHKIMEGKGTWEKH